MKPLSKSLSLRAYLEQAARHEHSAALPVIGFAGDTYAPSFFSLLRVFHERVSGIAVQLLDPTAVDLGQAELLLSTSFLGTVHTYWLGDMTEVDAKSQKKWRGYLETYRGPHTLHYFVRAEAERPGTEDVVRLENAYGIAECKVILGLLLARPIPEHFFKAIERKYRHMALEQLCMLAKYALVVGGASLEAFVSQWLDRIVEPEQSLFLLSQHFFAGDERRFFALWQQMKHLYAAVFWISFWSEQLWRAHYYVTFKRAGDVARARTVGYRLPFSLLQKDWQKVCPNRLQKAHDYLYRLDGYVKNSVQEDCLELMYTKFFTTGW